MMREERKREERGGASDDGWEGVEREKGKCRRRRGGRWREEIGEEEGGNARAAEKGRGGLKESGAAMA